MQQSARILSRRIHASEDVPLDLSSPSNTQRNETSDPLNLSSQNLSEAVIRNCYSEPIDQRNFNSLYVNSHQTNDNVYGAQHSNTARTNQHNQYEHLNNRTDYNNVQTSYINRRNDDYYQYPSDSVVRYNQRHQSTLHREPNDNAIQLCPRENSHFDYTGYHYHTQVKDITPLLIDYDPEKTSLKFFLQNVDRVRDMYNPHDLILLHAVTLKLKENARKWYESINASFQSWNSLRNALLNEFADTRDSVDVHRALNNRKCGQHEDIIDYAYEMRKLATEADIQEKDIIKYIITGLNNQYLTNSLGILNITTFNELMMRLRAYKTMNPSSEYNYRGPTTHRRDQLHFNRDAPYRRENRRLICAYCKQEGHYAVNCTKTKQNEKNNSTITSAKSVNCVVATSEYLKTIRLNGHNVDAFVDLGSECTILDKCTANKIFSQYEQFYQKLRGFGNGFCVAVGRVFSVIVIDNIELNNCEILIVENLVQPANMILGHNIFNREHLRVVKGFNFLKVMSVSPKEVNDMNIQNEAQQYSNINKSVLSVSVDKFDLLMVKAIGEDVDDQKKCMLVELFKKYRHCFALGMDEIGLTNKASIEIKLKDNIPVCYQPYRLSYAQKQIVEKQINEMQLNNIIKPSTSPYSSPIVIVKKKDGGERLCVDYRKLNGKTVKDHFPLPNMEDVIQRLAGMKYFTVVDLSCGYYQLSVNEDSRHLTAFVTPDGKYEFNRMPFGLVNAPSAFQRMMNNIARELNNKVVPYLDDVVLPSETIEEGINLIKLFLDKIAEYGLTLKPEKCKFLQTQIDFLGYEVNHEGIRPGKEKILCVERFATPSNVHEIRRFVGLASYFRKFVPKFAEVAKPLTDLTRKDVVFVWGLEQEEAFCKLKSSLCSLDTLALYDPKLNHEIHTDACSVGLAGILIQVQDTIKRPVAYFSRKTNSAEHNYHSYELETLAVVESVERFRVYVLGKAFTVITDCESLKATALKRHVIPRIARWLLRLQEYDCTIQHRSGQQMIHVDALSRAPVLDEAECDEACLQVLCVEDENKWVIALQRTDPEIIELKKQIVAKDPNMKSYIIKDECVYFKTENDDALFVIPKSLRSRVVSEAHSAGHFGLEKTIENLKRNFYFNKMRSYVKRHIESCVDCLYKKEKSGAQGIELHPIEKIPIPQHTIHIDHIGPFVKSSRKNAYVIVFVDAFTKYIHLKPAKDTSTKFVTKALDELVLTFGSPTRIITDKGSAFTSNSFKHYCENLNITHILNATATPRGNGQVERENRTFLNSLRTMVTEGKEQNWETKLRIIQWTINTNKNSVTKQSPHEMLFGYMPRCIFNDKLTLQLEDDKAIEKRANYTEQIILNRTEAYNNIKKHQEYSKKHFDAKHRKPDQYYVGDLVMAKREVVSTGTSTKLQPRYKGPYRVIEKLHADRYRIQDVSVASGKRRYTGVYPAEKLKLVKAPEESSDSDEEE